MAKLLHSDWLREMQFSRNIVQKNENSVQKEGISQAFWLINEQTKSD